jgi:hypothetical protein
MEHLFTITITVDSPPHTIYSVDKEAKACFCRKNERIQSKKQVKWDLMDAHVCVANGS